MTSRPDPRAALAAALATCAIALALVPFRDAPSRHARHPRPPGVRVADMGMGSFGPQLGGDSDDMVLDDPGQDIGTTSPGFVSSPGQDIGTTSPGFVSSPGQDIGNSPGEVSNPGFLPPEPQMDIQPQQDLDQDDYLD